MSRFGLIDTKGVAEIIGRSVGHTRDRVIHSATFTPRKYWDGKEYKFSKEAVESWYIETLKKSKPPRRNPARSG